MRSIWMRSGFIGHKWQDASQMRLGTIPLQRNFLSGKVGQVGLLGQVGTSPELNRIVVTGHDLTISALITAKIIFTTRIAVNIVHHHQHASHLDTISSIAVNIMSCAVCFEC